MSLLAVFLPVVKGRNPQLKAEVQQREHHLSRLGCERVVGSLRNGFGFNELSGHVLALRASGMPGPTRIVNFGGV